MGRKASRSLLMLGCLWIASGCPVLADQGQKRVEGYATWYSMASCKREGTSGVRTANGEVYDETTLTAALPSHQFGGSYRVCTTTAWPRCVVVRHNDYGPSRVPASRGVVIDLTPVAFAALAPLSQGVIPVTVTAIKDSSSL